MSSPERAFWEFLVTIGDALVDNDDLDLIIKGRRLADVPTAYHAKRLLGLYPVQTLEGPESDEDELDDVGPIPWIGRFDLVVAVADPGGDIDRDLVAGSDANPGLLDVASRVRDVVDWNFSELSTDVARRWKSITYAVEEDYPRFSVRMRLEIRSAVPVFNRAGGSFPPPTVPASAGRTLGELSDVTDGGSGPILYKTGGAWVSGSIASAGLAAAVHAHENADIYKPSVAANSVAVFLDDETLDADEAAFLERGVLKLLTPTGDVPLYLHLATSTPTPGNGGFWPELVGGVVYLKYKREDTGAVVKVALT